MITAKEANKKAFESERMRKQLKEKHYLEIMDKIGIAISKQALDGYFSVDLKTSFMYPFRDRIMEELVRNGYKVELHPANGIFTEYLLISWE